jgi:NitT/TauT family transport system permease protein
VPYPHGHARSGLMLGLLIVSGWELAGRILAIRPSTLPVPTRILMEIWQDSAGFQTKSLITATEMVSGLVLGIVCAVILGSLMYLYPRTQSAVEGLTALWPAFPMLVVAPLFLVWWGPGFLSKAMVACAFSVLPLIRGVASGMCSLPDELTKWLLTSGTRRRRGVVKIFLPSSMPFLFQSLVPACSLALTGALTAELIAGDRGLGYLLLVGTAAMDTPLLMATALVSCTILTIILVSVRLLRRRLITWPVPQAADSQFPVGDKAYWT